MRVSATSICSVALVVSIGACGYSAAQGLVGLWQTKTVRMTPPGRTNVIEAYQAVEFLKEGSFKMSSAVITDGEKR